MISIAKAFLSQSTNGRPIAIAAANAGAADTVHATPAGLETIDEIWLWANNPTAAEITVTLCFGGVTAADQLTVAIPANTTQQLLPGFPLQNALLVKAFASAAGLNVGGFVNRITP